MPPQASWLLVLTLPATAGAACPPLFHRELEPPFAVCDSTGQLPHAWYGGWRNARPQLLDVDADGDLDLFVAEEQGRLRFFRNAGDATSWVWIQETDDYGGFHELYWSRFVDIDADGDFDVLVEVDPFQSGGTTVRAAALYTDVGSPGAPDHVNLSPHPGGYFVDENGAPIQIELTVPDFVDLDGDGDQDLMMGVSLGGSGPVRLFRNVGTPSSPSFRHETDSYGNINIILSSCFPPGPRPRSSNAHGFMLFSFHDVNSDLLPDMFVGDSFNSNVYHWENTGGSVQNPDFACRTFEYFRDPGGGAAFVGQRAVPAFGDLDGDGDPDAVVGSGESHGLGLVFYRNEGTAQAPMHVQESASWIPEMDYGADTQPAFADLDRDGDLDLWLGAVTRQRVMRFDDQGLAGPCRYLLTEPDWRFVPNSDWLAPEFADIDCDGDEDLFLGGSQGEILWFRNDGNGPDPGDFVEVTTDADFGDGATRTFRAALESQSVPRFFDEDADGDLDLLVGFRTLSSPLSTPLYLFRNDGDCTQHRFVLASTDYSGLGLLGQGTAPALGDLDGDGDADAVVGRLDGGISFLRNVGTPRHPAFVREEDELGGIDVGVRSVPALVDLDADGDLDLVVGESGGGLNFFRNLTQPAAPLTSFALTDPAPGELVDGSRDHLFTWEKSLDPSSGTEAVYELRLAADPGDPPSAWTVVSSMGNEAMVRLHSTPLGGQDAFWWTVSAGSGCLSAPVPEWRRGVLDPDPRGQLPGAVERRTLPRPNLRLAVTAAYPSPSLDVTTIRYTLPAEGPVRLTIHDATGRTVRVLRDGTEPRGQHVEFWDGRSAAGRFVAPGLYVIRIEQAGQVASRRAARLR